MPSPTDLRQPVTMTFRAAAPFVKLLSQYGFRDHLGLVLGDERGGIALGKSTNLAGVLLCIGNSNEIVS
jgi:hypothetical protein